MRDAYESHISSQIFQTHRSHRCFKANIDSTIEISLSCQCVLCSFEVIEVILFVHDRGQKL